MASPALYNEQFTSTQVRLDREDVLKTKVKQIPDITELTSKVLVSQKMVNLLLDISENDLQRRYLVNTLQNLINIELDLQNILGK